MSLDNNENRIRRLLRPSPVVNWTRVNLRRLDETRKQLLRFALVPPKHSLGEAYRICAEIANSHISLEAALTEVEDIKHPITRASARELVPAFFWYANDNQLDGVEALYGRGTPFPIGHAPDGGTRVIPVTPTFIAVEENKLKPYFLIGWSKPAYDDYQKRLLSTIIVKSLLTQQDYLDSDAQIVCLPRSKWSKSRRIQEWPARLYGTLTDEELNEQFDRYGKALAEVIRELKGE